MMCSGFCAKMLASGSVSMAKDTSSGSFDSPLLLPVARARSGWTVVEGCPCGSRHICTKVLAFPFADFSSKMM